MNTAATILEALNETNKSHGRRANAARRLTKCEGASDTSPAAGRRPVLLPEDASKKGDLKGTVSTDSRGISRMQSQLFHVVERGPIDTFIKLVELDRHLSKEHTGGQFKGSNCAILIFLSSQFVHQDRRG
jgi:hypothetical protein